MPITKQAFKRMRADKKRRLRNLDVKSELKTLDKKFEELVSSNKRDEAKKLALDLISKLDKAATKKIIPKERASRKKSRLLKRLSAKAA